MNIRVIYCQFKNVTLLKPDADAVVAASWRTITTIKYKCKYLCNCSKAKIKCCHIRRVCNEEIWNTFIQNWH